MSRPARKPGRKLPASKPGPGLALPLSRTRGSQGPRARPFPLRPRPRLRLRTRFLGSIAAFTVLISLASALAGTYIASRHLRQQLLRQGEILVSQLARDAIKDDQEADPASRRMRLQVLTYRLAADAGYARVVFGGQAISEFVGPDAPEPPPPPSPLRGLIIREVAPGASSSPARYLDFIQVLPDRPAARPRRASSSGAGPRPAGDPAPAAAPSYVQVGIPLAPVDELNRRLSAAAALMMLVFSLAGGLMALGLYRGVLGPLDRLVRAVQRLSEGDLSARADLATGDELQLVAEEFNRMAEALAARDRRLQQMNRELVEANEAKSQFLAIMAHEWKTPLHSIRGYCQLLLEQVDGPLNPEQRQDVETILHASTHLLGFVDNLLFYNAAEETAPARPEAVDMVALTRDAWNHLRPLAQGRQLTFRAELAPTLYARGDALQLRQVLINLLSNAIKYTPEGAITVTGGRAGPEVWWAVADTGVGIDPSQLPRIFEPFHRGGGGHPGVDGLGLGLAVVARFVKAHGGRVEVDSEPGRGSRFIVYLPAADGVLPLADTAPAPAPAEAELPTAGVGENP